MLPIMNPDGASSTGIGGHSAGYGPGQRPAVRGGGSDGPPNRPMGAANRPEQGHGRSGGGSRQQGRATTGQDVPATSAGSRDGNNAGGDDDSEGGWQQPRRRQRKFVTGRGSSTQFRGAPRDFFLHHVDKETSTDVIKTFLQEAGIPFVSFIKVSNEAAMFNSYRLTVHVDQAEKVMDPELWPTGVRIKRFWSRREKKQTVNGS